jgi:hypothetical protein
VVVNQEGIKILCGLLKVAPTENRGGNNGLLKVAPTELRGGNGVFSRWQG